MVCNVAYICLCTAMIFQHLLAQGKLACPSAPMKHAIPSWSIVHVPIPPSQALLGDDHGAGGDGAGLRALVGSVINVNFPAGDRLRGLYLAHQARQSLLSQCTLECKTCHSQRLWCFWDDGSRAQPVHLYDDSP